MLFGALMIASAKMDLTELPFDTGAVAGVWPRVDGPPMRRKRLLQQLQCLAISRHPAGLLCCLDQIVERPFAHLSPRVVECEEAGDLVRSLHVKLLENRCDPSVKLMALFEEEALVDRLVG